ncbi:MAG TPA: hypothetical protein VFR55_08775 [Dehalococcoidia bacterium]|nr:hypothetical protein [Dehalococcoidia bacterium]
MTTMNSVINLRIPEGLLELAELCARGQRTDRSTVLRQWLYLGAEDYILKRLSEGTLSIGKATELLDTTHYDLHNLARARGFEIGADEQAQEYAMEVAESVKLTPRERTRTQ